MTARFAILLALVSCLWPHKSTASVNVLNDNLMLPVVVAVSNVSSEPVVFLLTGANCRAQAPLTFTVGPNGGYQVVSMTWNYHDHGFDNCYARHHYAEYTDVANSNNRFRIVQSNDGGNNYYCNDIEYYAFYWINQAVCPVVSGNLVTAQNSTTQVAPYCPPGVPMCPPYDDGTTIYFGVLVPQSGPVTSSAPLPPLATGYDFSEAGPFKSSCVYDATTVPPPLDAVWHAVEIPELGTAEATAWLEPCVNTTPGDPYHFWEAEVLAVVRKPLSAPVTSYSYRIPYSYSDGASTRFSTGEHVDVTGPAVSTIVIPMRFDRQQIGSATSVNIANLTIGGVTLSTDATLPRGGAVVREYYLRQYDEYFVTADDFENPAARAPSLWSPTGQWWRVRTTPALALAPVCRFWSGEAFTPRSTHFYTPYASECTEIKKSTTWIYESIAFQVALPDAAGACPPGLRAMYRIYNDGMGNVPNHRYTVDAQIRDEMTRKGGVLEGQGPDGVFACVPG